MPLACTESSTHRVGLYHDPHSSRWETDWYRPLGGAPSTHILKASPNRNILYLDAAAKGPAVFDEIECKAADLHEDIAPRKEVLAKIAGSN